jgi:hypothetical protein
MAFAWFVWDKVNNDYSKLKWIRRWDKKEEKSN